MVKNCVFLHLPRTGGSSIWHSLVDLATGRRRGICDIYHHTKQTFGAPIRGGEIIAELRQRVPEMPCLFHHHTDEPVLDCFPTNESLFATVLRDPVERFVSEVFHSRSFLRSCSDPQFVAYHERHWGRIYVRALLDPRIKTWQLLDVAASVRFFHNYYTKFFANLLALRPARSGTAITAAGAYLQHLASEIRSKVDVVVFFDDLQDAYSRIVTAFELGDGSERLKHAINVASRSRAVPGEHRRRYRRLFRSDYELIEMLTRKSQNNTFAPLRRSAA